MAHPETVRANALATIAVHVDRCDGCGTCVQSCPTGAINLLDGAATVDQTLCRGCGACVDACPKEALTLVEQETRLSLVPDHRPEHEPILVGLGPAPIAPLPKVLPAVAAALAWAGREILPRLLPRLLDILDRRNPGSGDARETTRAGDTGDGTRGRHRFGRRGGAV